MIESADVALAEFTALRAEILALQQTESVAFTAAFTVIAAVGGFALAKQGGRLELLLILPVILSGLALLQAQCLRQAFQIGDYFRRCLWTRLPTGGAPSWEHFIASSRRRVHGVAARALIFGVPSVASIVITDHQWNTKLAPLWWGDVLVLGASGLLALTVLAPQSESASKTRDR